MKIAPPMSRTERWPTPSGERGYGDAGQHGGGKRNRTSSRPEAATSIAHAKAWGMFDGTNTGTFSPATGHGVTSITRTCTGTYTVALSTPMSSASYAVMATACQSAPDLPEDSFGTDP